MPRAKLEGKRFGRLLVLRSDGLMHRARTAWLCRCDCGNEKRVHTNDLNSGHVVSCGCFQREARVQHGHAARIGRGPTYLTWQSMIARCTNPKAGEWRWYGGRGIAVCERWRTFENFLADMGERPNGKTIDRIDTNGNYEPSNCRWATWAEQCSSKRPRSCYKLPPIAADEAER